MQLVYTNSSILLWNLTGQLHSLESHTKVICCFFCICRVIDKCGNSFMLGISWNKSDYLDPLTWFSAVAYITIFHAVLSKICGFILMLFCFWHMQELKLLHELCSWCNLRLASEDLTRYQHLSKCLTTYVCSIEQQGRPVMPATIFPLIALKPDHCVHWTNANCDVPHVSYSIINMQWQYECIITMRILAIFYSAYSAMTVVF